MKLINKDIDYAARALITLAGSGKALMSARDIADAQKIPYHYLRRIFRALIAHGIVGSKEGATGGLKLIKDAGKISIYDLIKIYHEDFGLTACMAKGNLCPNHKVCVLRCEVTKIEKDVIGKFKKITIKKLL